MLLRSIVPYVGGKNNVADFLVNQFPNGFRSYREPFLGGGSILIRLLQTIPSRSLESIVCGDLNKDIYACWYCISKLKDRAENLLTIFLESVLGTDLIITDEGIRRLWDACYDSDKDIVGLLGDRGLSGYDIYQLDLFIRYYVLTQISFSGMAYNAGLSLSNGKRVLGNLIKQLGSVFNGYDTLLEGVSIQNQDFWETIKDSDDGTFIFLDPPYYTQEGSRLYGRNGDLHKGFEHERLRDRLNELDGRGVKFLITYDDSEYIRGLYKDYHIEEYKLRYSTNMANGSRVGHEILISNYVLYDTSDVDTSTF